VGLAGFLRASEAWSSLQILNHQVALGWFIRALHGWGSNFMVAIVLIHMVQVFLFGAYKFPRELTWILGVFLLLMTLGMAFTGQVLRFDQDAYWGLGIGASIVSRVPLLGPSLDHRSVESWPIWFSSILYFQRKMTGSALICSK
jgi:ubiquinol-cytochrome c reductase cytochrome b subunit